MGRDLGSGVGLVEQPELSVRQLLRRRPKAPGQQQPHLLLQLLDSRIARLDRRLVVFDRRLMLLDRRVALDNLQFELTHPRSQCSEFVGPCVA